MRERKNCGPHRAIQSRIGTHRHDNPSCKRRCCGAATLWHRADQSRADAVPTLLWQYALYRHISRAVGLIALTLLGGLITDFGSAFCFTVSFLFLRERTGGYHAKTEWQCALYSAAMIFATMFALPIFAEEPNNYWAIMIASSALIWVSSPADNKQIHLSRAESKAMAKRARLRLLLLDAVSLALLGVHGHLFVSSIALAELSVAVSLMMATAGFGIQ